MMTGRCLRLLSRSAALLRQQLAPAAGRRLAAAAGTDHPPASAGVGPPPAPPLALLLCQSRHRLAVPRPSPAPAIPGSGAAPRHRLAVPRPDPAPAVPESGAAPGVGPALSRLTLCCLPWRGAAPPSSRSAPSPVHQLCAGRVTHWDRCRAAWPSAQYRLFSERSEGGRPSMVQDMRRTGHKVRATVGHMVSHENIYTIPNALCVTRIALTPVIGWLVTSELYTPALVCFIVAGVTDLLDGWIARTFPGQSSLLGSFLDPLADKLLVATLFLSLTYTGLIPLGLTLLTVARDLGLITAASWVRYKSVPPPVTLSRYFDPTFATARLEPTLISKFNTFLQITLVASTLAAPVMGFVDHTALRLLWCVTAGTTVTSGMVYALLQSSTYKLMEQGDNKRSP